VSQPWASRGPGPREPLTRCGHGPRVQPEQLHLVLLGPPVLELGRAARHDPAVRDAFAERNGRYLDPGLILASGRLAPPRGRRPRAATGRLGIGSLPNLGASRAFFCPVHLTPPPLADGPRLQGTGATTATGPSPDGPFRAVRGRPIVLLAEPRPCDVFSVSPSLLALTPTQRSSLSNYFCFFPLI
jgi:hypothetical protein